MIDIAYAMGTGGTGGQGGSGWQTFIPIILMFAIFYFLLIRPQQKKAKEHRALLSAIKKGDKVVSNAVCSVRICLLVALSSTMSTRLPVSRGSIAGIGK